MAIISEFARRKKLDYFFKGIDKQARILEVGSGNGWLGEQLRARGWHNYTGLDMVPPADVVGDVRNWKALGLKPGAFDCVVAFEVVEHADIFQACYDLLHDDGLLLVTTPLPHMDWFLQLLEKAGLNQQRTSPHTHLVYLKEVELFVAQELKYPAWLSQWAKLRKNFKQALNNEAV